MRISERISSAISGVKCPGCGKFVRPMPPPPAEETAPGDTGKRWSFVWRDPSGEVCPECSFPLARFAKRLKWIRVFSVGVVLLTVAALLYLLGRMAEFPTWYPWAVKATAAAGLLAFLVGLGGLVIGGQSDPSSAPPASG